LLFLGICGTSASAIGPVPSSATWTGEGGDANWTTGENWDVGVAPGSSTGTIDSTYATFNVADNTAVTVDAWRNIKFIQFGGSAQKAAPLGPRQAAGGQHGAAHAQHGRTGAAS